MDTKVEPPLVVDSEEASDAEEVNTERKPAGAKEILRDFQRIGITLGVLGLCSIVSSIVTVIISWRYPGLTSSGIWCGVFAIDAGCLAVVAKYHLTKWVIIANIVATALASLFGLINIIMSIYVALDHLYRDAAVVVFSALQCSLAIAWMVLCVYHLTITARTLEFGIQSVKIQKLR